MPLLIVPLLVLALLALWLLLLPLSLWQRYRMGKARRRALPWLVRLNAWLLLASALLFLLSMGVAGLWWPNATAYALGGLAAGLATGTAGLWLSRFEYTPQGLFYTPNAWLSLALVLLVAARLAMGVVETWRYWQGRDALSMLPAFEHASLFAVAGVLLGHYLAYGWGLRRRLPLRLR
jgi:hypothetical protein